MTVVLRRRLAVRTREDGALLGWLPVAFGAGLWPGRELEFPPLTLVVEVWEDPPPSARKSHVLLIPFGDYATLLTVEDFLSVEQVEQSLADQHREGRYLK
jgi:hypothetical protein